MWRRWLETECETGDIWLAPALLGGIILYFTPADEPPLWLALAWPVAALMAWLCLRGRGFVALIPALLLAAGLGFAAGAVHARAVPPWDPPVEKSVLVTGDILAVEDFADHRRVLLDDAGLSPGGAMARRIRLRLRAGDGAALAPGARIAVRALLSLPPPPSYPDGPDPARAAWFGDIGFYGFAIAHPQILIASPAGPLDRLREKIARRIRIVLPGPEGAIAADLLCGQGEAIPANLRADFAASGLAHLLAVAGLHLGIVMALVFESLRFAMALHERIALSWPTRRIATIASLAAGFVYLMMTGAHLPGLRSFAMAVLASLALFAGRRAISLRALGIAAGLLALCAPEAVLGVSFQMSFSAVLALVTFYRMAWPKFVAVLPQHPAARFLAGLTLSSCLAGTASLPFAAYHFGSAGLLYVPANILAIPLTAGVILPSGLAAVMAMPLGLDAPFLAVMGKGIALLIWLAAKIAALPGAAWLLPALPPGFAVCCAAALCCLCLAKTRFLRGVGAVAGAIALLIAVTARPPAILVSTSARAILIRGVPLLAEAMRADHYAVSVLLRAAGMGPATKLQSCDGDFCTRTVDSVKILIANSRDAVPDCAGIILTLASFRGGEICPGVPAIDAQDAADGGVALWLSPALIVRQAASTRAGRLWAATSDNLPMAPRE